MYWLSADLKLVWANKAWEELTGHPFESVSGLVCNAHGPTHAGDTIGLGGSFYPPPEALAGHPASGPTLIIHVSGERRWRRIEFWPFLDGQGRLLGILALVRASEEPPLAPESEAQRLRSELLEVRNRLHGRYGFDHLIGAGPAHRRLVEQVIAAANTTVPVLIVGAPGTGKRLVARTIHQLSARKQAAIVAFDCAALPPEILERELFGGTAESPAIPFSRVEGTTLLIGDILDLPRDLQSRLAAMNGTRVRLLATTTGDPEAALRDERLRPDLYYLLTTLVIHLRPLRERLDELPILAQHMLERANIRGGRQRSGFTPEAISALLEYDWPGNLRELARVVDDAHERGGQDAIGVEDLPAGIRGNLGAAYLPPPWPPRTAPLDELLTQVERRLIENALQQARHNKSRASELLGISRPRLYRRIKELNLPDVPEPAEETPSNNGNAAH